MEALQSIYQSDLNILSSKAGIPYGYKLEVKPHTALETGEIYCEAFNSKIPKEYPKNPIRYEIETIKGLSSEEVEELQVYSKGAARIVQRGNCICI